jgi:hypothetical protein
MEPVKCAIECVRWQVEGRCVHIGSAYQQLEDKKKLEEMRAEKRAAKVKARAERAAWEVEPRIWRSTENWVDLPYKEGVYVWVTDKPLVVGYFSDLRRGHYGLCNAGSMQYVRNGVIWWLETALTVEITEFLIDYLWGGRKEYKRTLTKKPFDAATRELALRVHPMHSLWPRTQVVAIPVQPQQLEFWL